MPEAESRTCIKRTIHFKAAACFGVREGSWQDVASAKGAVKAALGPLHAAPGIDRKGFLSVHACL